MASSAMRSLSVLLIAGVANVGLAQTPEVQPMDADERAAVVERTGRMLTERYVFLDVAEAGFGSSTPRALVGNQLVSHPAVELFVGYVNGVAATTSALITTGRVAGIYWVSTLKSYRGSGLGEALTAHAIRAGQARGCDTATLRASAMGRPIYERMGFSLSDDFISYMIPGPR